LIIQLKIIGPTISFIIIIVLIGSCTSNVIASDEHDNAGIIHGDIYDIETSILIVNASVKVYNDENQKIVGQNQSDINGYYEIKNLSAGNYTVEVSAKYYIDKQTNVTLEINQSLKLYISLVPMDTDQDSVPDYADEFPEDPLESKDTDGDGHGDFEDAYPLDPNRWEHLDPPDSDDGGGLIGKSEDKEGGTLYYTLYIIISTVIIVVVLLAAVMYTRLKSRRLLEHQTREKLFNYIQTNPGIHYRGIMNALGLSMGVQTHHLNMLERQGYIKSLQDGPYRRFYPKDMKVDTDLLLTDPQQAILDAIKINPGISQSKIASDLQMTKKTVYYNVSQLKDAGLVFIDKDGRETECFYAGET
jgi:predicted transcriptional regulator